MTQEDIIRMTREAGPLISTPFDVWCERFAALVAAAENKACENLCEDLQQMWKTANDCADAIKTRRQSMNKQTGPKFGCVHHEEQK